MAYKRRKKRGEPITFPIVVRNPYSGEAETLTITAKHLWAHEFFSLDDKLIGSVKFGQADPEGSNKLRRAQLRVKEYVERIEGVDPEEAKEFGGLADNQSCVRYLEEPGNEDLVYFIDPGYHDALFRTLAPESTSDRGEGDGEDAVGIGAGRPAA
jgi:hypothetical protein